MSLPRLSAVLEPIWPDPGLRLSRSTRHAAIAIGLSLVSVAGLAWAYLQGAS